MAMSGSFLSLVVEAIVSLRNSLSTASPEFSRTAGTMLVTAIWQGAVVAACLTICLKLTNRISAALRFIVWSAGFLAVVGLPFLPLLMHWISGPAAHPALALTNAPASASVGPEPWLRLDIRWSIALTAVWAAVSLYRLADLAVHSVRLRRLWRTATPVALTTKFSPLLTASISLPGRRPVEICTTDALDRPSVIGFLAPRILIPAWLLDQLTQGELEQIVLHETEHLRRGDDWTNLLQKLSLVVFPLNPVLLWMERQLCLEREMACDEAVIRVTGEPRAYAACLTSLAERGVHRRAEALSLGAWHRRPELVRRVHRILRRRDALGPLGARSVLTVMACGLIFGTVELSRCPQLIAFTQSPEAETAEQHTLAAQGIPARMPFRMVDTRFTEPPQAVAPPAVDAGKQRPAGFKSNRPCRTGNSQGIGGKYQHVNASLAAQPASRFVAATAPRQELLKAEAAEAVTAQASAPTQETQQQSWIVLTTWEEVDAPAQDAAQSDFATGQPADQVDAQSTGIQAEKLPQQRPGQLKVTQLIFRIDPAASKSHVPTAVPVRGGWLVIQL